MVFKKYLSGLLAVGILFLTSFQAAVQGGLTPTEAWQLAGVFVGVFVTTFVPLTPGKWAASLKVTGAVIGAVIAAIVPFVTQGWSIDALTIVVLAAFNTLAVQLGVNARVDEARLQLTDPNKSDTAINAVDPKAVEAAQQSEVQRIA